MASEDRDSQSALLPMTSAMHGITSSQNVSHAVAERIADLEAGVKVSRGLAWTFFVAPILLTLLLLAAEEYVAAIGFGYFGIWFLPIGIAVHWYRKRALKQARMLDRGRDVAWVSPTDGLVFFSDDGLYVQNRGGFRPYGVETRRFSEVTVAHEKLTLHGMDAQSGATYSIDMQVPSGWTDEDTARVRAKLDAFRA